MPTDANPITLRKLTLIKQLHQQAMAQAGRRHSVVSRIMAVVGFDISIETALKAVVGALETGKTPKDAFQPLMQQADSALTSRGDPPVPDKVNILHVHGLRNDAQHKARIPTDSEVGDCRTYTRDFLRKLVADVWGLSYDGLSLTGLIQHPEVKTLLVDAETKLAGGDYASAVKAASSGLAMAIMHVEGAVVGPEDSFVEAFVVDDGSGDHHSDQNTYRTFRRMQETLLYIALGMDFADYTRLRKIAGEAALMMSGEWHHIGGQERPGLDDAEFVVAYCVNAVAQIETIVGDLEEPFGKNWRWDY